MPREARAYLFEIREATDRIIRFVEGRSLEQYRTDDLLRSAVERQFTIIGEAIAQIDRHHPGVAAKIPDRKRIVAFRNILVHAYVHIDDRVVWSLIVTDLPALREKVSAIELGDG